MQTVFALLPRPCLRSLRTVRVPRTAAACVAIVGHLRGLMQAACRGPIAHAARPGSSCSSHLPGRTCPALLHSIAATQLATGADHRNRHGCQIHGHLPVHGASAGRQAPASAEIRAASQPGAGPDQVLLSAFEGLHAPLVTVNASSFSRSADSSSSRRSNNSSSSSRRSNYSSSSSRGSSSSDGRANNQELGASSRRRRRKQQVGSEHMSAATSNTAGLDAYTPPALLSSSDAPGFSIGSLDPSHSPHRPLDDTLTGRQDDAQQHDSDLHQQQTQQATKMLLLGIDPDTNGAVAVISADLVPQHLPASSGGGTGCSNTSCGGSSSTSTSSTLVARRQKPSSSSKSRTINNNEQQQQQLLHVDLSNALISIYDMPVESIPLRKSTKTSPQRYRRRLDVACAVATIKKILHQHQLFPSRHSTDSSCNCSSSSSNHRVVLRAVLEVSSIVPTNGSLSTLNQGFSLGAWTAALLALGFEMSTVHVRQWKKDLGLMNRDKDCSRQLAQEIFNAAGNSQDQLLSRKKDHGRAEALLIAAWGCGWSADDLSSNSSTRTQRRKPASKARRGARGSSHSGSDQEEDGANSSCSSAGWLAQQGPMRDVVRMDGGMHTLVAADATGHTPTDDCNGLDGWLNAAAAAQPAAVRQKSKLSRRSSSKRRAVRKSGGATAELEQQQ